MIENWGKGHTSELGRVLMAATPQTGLLETEQGWD